MSFVSLVVLLFLVWFFCSKAFFISKSFFVSKAFLAYIRGWISEFFSWWKIFSISKIFSWIWWSTRGRWICPISSRIRWLIIISSRIWWPISSSWRKWSSSSSFSSSSVTFFCSIDNRLFPVDGFVGKGTGNGFCVAWWDADKRKIFHHLQIINISACYSWFFGNQLQ